MGIRRVPPRVPPPIPRTPDQIEEERREQAANAGPAYTTPDEPERIEDIRSLPERSPERGGPAPTPSPAPAPTPELPGDMEATDPYGELNRVAMGEIDPILEELTGAYGTAGDEIVAGAQGYADALRGGDPYAALQGDADRLLQHYEQGGLTDVTRAQLESNRRGADQFVRSNREAALQDLAERGMAGGGAEVLALQGDRAAAADRMNAQDLDAAAFGQQSAMDALAAHGDAQSDMYDREKGLENTLYDAGRDATSLDLDVAGIVAETGLGVALDNFDMVRTQMGDSFTQLREDAPGAGDDASETLTGAAEGDRGEALDQLGGEIDNLDVPPLPTSTPDQTTVPGVAPIPNAGKVEGIVGGAVEIGKAAYTGGASAGFGGLGTDHSKPDEPGRGPGRGKHGTFNEEETFGRY